LADKDKRIEFELPEDGSGRGSVFIPPLAMDSTLQDLLKNNQALKTNLDKYLVAVAKKMDNGELSDAVKDLIETIEDSKDTTETKTKEVNEELETFGEATKGATEKLGQSQENLDDLNKRIAQEKNALGRMTAQFSKDMIFTLNAFDFVFKSLVSFGTITGGYLVASVGNTGEALKSLTDVGQAFGDTTGKSNQTTLQTIQAFTRMGITVDQATTTLSTFSRTASVLGQKGLTDLNKQFLELTNYGQDLGVTLDDATQLFQEDLDFRARTLTRNQFNEARNADLSFRSIQNLRLFSTALGISTDELRQSSRNLLEGNAGITSLIRNFGSRGPEVQAAIENLVGGLQGAEVDDNFIQGILEVATVGASGASNFLNQLGTIDSGLREEFVNIAMRLRDGAFSLDEVPSILNDILSEFSTSDPAKFLSLLASDVGGDLQNMAQAYINSSQSAINAQQNIQQQMQTLGLDTKDRYDDVQKALTGVQNIIKKLSATAGTLQLGIVTGLSKSFTDFFKNQGQVNDLLKRFGGVIQKIGMDIGNTLGEFLEKLGGGNFEEGLTKVIDSIATFGKNFNTYLENILNGFLDKDNQLQIGKGIINYAADTIAFVGVQALKIIGIALAKGLGMLFSESTGVLAISIIGLFAAKAVVSALITSASGMILSFFGRMIPTASMALSAGMTTWWTGFSTWMTTSWAGLMARLGMMTTGAGGVPFVGPPSPGAPKGASKFLNPTNLVRGGAVLSGVMVAKDGYDVVAGTDGGATGSNIGGLVGGGLGALGFFLGPLGGAIGMAAGNVIGSAIGGMFDKPNKSKVDTPSADVTAMENEDGSISYVSGGTINNSSNRITYKALDAITDRAGRNENGDFIVGDQPLINRMSDESKILTGVLGELKHHRTILNEMKGKIIN